MQIIASDGVWDVLSPEQAVSHVMESKRQGRTAVQAARALVEAVVQKSKEDEDEQDNTSAIVVLFAPPASAHSRGSVGNIP
jgi:serine/threonine protein phosphatase PrpC